MNNIQNYKPLLFLVALLLSIPAVTHASAHQDSATLNTEKGIQWQTWNENVFRKAREQHKLILLNLEAVWCHWCHVMDKQTYSDDSVIAQLEQHYIAVKVDHDANPGLANQYRDYGWPATIIFDADGNEIVKRAGYIKPENMNRLLQAIVKDPSPETVSTLSTQTSGNATIGVLSDELRSTLQQRHNAAYDEEKGGLKLFQKFLDRDSVEYAMLLARQGNEQAEKRARHTLTAALNLLDPAWGGFYQYSTQRDWQHAHFEKIMRVQASYLRIYALAYAQFSDPEYLHASNEIRRYLNHFLKSGNGAYFVSQDADLVPGEHSSEYFELTAAQRLQRGIPAVDKNIYAQENGWIIEALASLYEVTGRKQVLDEAITASNTILHSHRDTATGGFAHKSLLPNTGKPQQLITFHLGDNLAMARAFLQLYRATSDRKWLSLSQQTADFIQSHFYRNNGGFISNENLDIPVKPVPDIDENISLARFSNLLFHYTGKQSYRTMSKHAMRFLSRSEIATARLTDPGILLADQELSSDPIHITVIGSKKEPASHELYTAALKINGWYKRVELWDRNEGELPNADVTYPVLTKPAAFLCTNNRCSLPVYTASDLQKIVHLITQAKAADNNRSSKA